MTTASTAAQKTADLPRWGDVAPAEMSEYEAGLRTRRWFA